MTSKITTSTDVEFEYLEVEYIARRRLLANLAFSKCSAWSGLNKVSDGGVTALARAPARAPARDRFLYIRAFGSHLLFFLL
jgi:hypothetical protein